MVFSLQKARNLAIKAELVIQEQNHSTNYRRYGKVDNKAPSDKGKTSLAMSDIMEIDNVGVGKGKTAIVEGGKGETFVLYKNK